MRHKDFRSYLLTSALTATLTGLLLAGPGASAQTPATITDAQGNKWAITAQGTVTQNGNPAAFTAQVVKLVNVGGRIYQQNKAGGWWAWNGTGWTGVSGDPTTGSVKATAIASGTGANFSLSPSGTVLINGSAEGQAPSAIKIVGLNGSIYAQSAAGNWLVWTGNTWNTVTIKGILARLSSVSCGQDISNCFTTASASAPTQTTSNAPTGSSTAGTSAVATDSTSGGSTGTTAGGNAAASALGSSVGATSTGTGGSTSGTATTTTPPNPASGATVTSGGDTTASTTTSCAGSSPSGATDPSITSLTDCAGNIWNLSDGQPEINGNPANIITNATLLLFYDGNIYYEDNGNNWYLWSTQDTGWSPIAGDPRTSGVTASVINGTCGNANATIVTTAPSGNLCIIGTATTVTGSGPWEWSCAGSNGGATASCVAAPPTTTACTQPGSGENLLTTGCFLNSLGVNTHLTWSDSSYASISNVKNALTYMGARYVRDSSPTASLLPAYASIANLGIKFDIIAYTQPINISQDLANLDALMQASPASVLSYEGPNEFNSNSYAYNGQSSMNNFRWGAMIDQALSSELHADPALQGVLYIAASLANTTAAGANAEGNVAGYVDISNWHTYFSNDQAPSVTITEDQAAAQIMAPGKPVWFTEMGCSTYDGSAGWGQCGGNAGGYILSMWGDAYKANVQHIFYYELLDNYLSPTSSDIEGNFGLFKSDGTPKAGATALHNLTSILNMNGASQSATSVNAVPVVSGLPSGGNSLILSNNQGGYDILVWNEGNGTASVTISLGASYASAQVFDPVQSPSPQQSLTNASSVQLSVGSDMLVIVAGNAPAQ